MSQQERLQSLFEKISDSYDGLVELKFINDEYADIQFLRGEMEIGRVRVSFARVVVAPEGKDIPLVKVVDHYGGEEVWVSPLPSAVIAVSTR